VRIVERVLRLAARGDDVALVELQADRAGNIALALVNEGLQRLAFRGEPEPVVDQFGVLRDE
jgi:hypothetical protein